MLTSNITDFAILQDTVGEYRDSSTRPCAELVKAHTHALHAITPSLGIKRRHRKPNGPLQTVTMLGITQRPGGQHFDNRQAKLALSVLFKGLSSLSHGIGKGLPNGTVRV